MSVLLLTKCQKLPAFSKRRFFGDIQQTFIQSQKFLRHSTNMINVLWHCLPLQILTSTFQLLIEQEMKIVVLTFSLFRKD